MTTARSILSLAVAAAVVSAAAAPSDASRGKRKVINQTRVHGGPSAIGGVTGSRSSQMVRVQQQRAQREAARRRLSPRDQLLAARDRQLGINAGVAPAFGSAQEAAAYTRLKARTIQIRSFALAAAAGIGAGFLTKLVAVAMTARTGFRELGSLASDPQFGNVIGQVVDGQFAVAAAIGAGVTLIAGSLRAAQLRRRADAIERGDVEVAELR